MKKYHLWFLAVVGISLALLLYFFPAWAATNLRITRLQLSFPNGLPKITVKRGAPDLKVSASIRTSGIGILEGYWEVDGRLMGRFSRHVASPDQTTVLTSPDIRALPTFDVGSHRVRLVITKPVQPITLPQAMYFVTAEEDVVRLALVVISPKDGMEIDASPIEFQWEKMEGIRAYCIEFQSEPENKPIFSSCIFEPGYILNDLALNLFFQPDETYTWQVTGIDTAGKTIAQSKLHRFRWKSK